MDCVWNCQKKVLQVFYKYGHFLASHLIFFMVIPVLVFGGLGFGFLQLETETDIETLYAPMNSRAIRNRDVVSETFPDKSGDNYDPSSTNTFALEGIALFRSEKEQAVFTSDEVLKELQEFNASVFAFTMEQDGKTYKYEDLCARAEGSCAVGGGLILAPFFWSMVANRSISYPVWITNQNGVDLSLFISDVKTTNGVLVSAGSVKLSFPLRRDTTESEKLSLAWELKFIEFMSSLNFTTLEVAYSTSQSLNIEVDKGTGGDILYFSLTFTLMITYASIVSSGGDCVSTRALLANAGVLSVLLGILGAFGFVTLTGIRFVNIVGVMPFLMLGIGVDDMFLLMNSWSETTSNTDMSIPERIGTVYKKAGIGITITSMTDCLAFAIGATSVFRSVRNFCAYTGVAVIMCYICNATFFGACLTLHGHRTYSSRHTLTCKVVKKTPSQLRREGRSCFYAHLCGGTYPRQPSDDQSICEKGPRAALTRFILWTPVRIITLIVFAGYLAVSIWGCTFLKQGLDLNDLILPSSYLHKYQVWDKENFGPKLPVSFVTTTTKNYRDPQVLKEIQDLFHSAQEDPEVNPSIQSCWLLSLANTPLYNTSSDAAFFAGLQTFLQIQPKFGNDIVFGQSNMAITASRCQIYTYKIIDSTEQADFMTRIRDLADSSPADVFAYHPAFVFFEQYISILPSTLMTVGVTFGVMFFVTCLFLPHPLMVLLVMVQVIMIVVGIFGFMSLWGLTLSSITMIHLIMSVGFSVDFCAHVCTAYMTSEQHTRGDRSRDAIVHASGPILNGGMSSLIGIIVLLLSESYVFQSFFRIMFLVISFGVLHAVFLIPVILSFIGPSTHVDLDTQGSGLHETFNNRNSVATVEVIGNDGKSNTGGKATISNVNAEENGDSSVHSSNTKVLRADDYLGYVKDSGE